MGRVHALAVLALQVLNSKINNESLLQFRATHHFLLNGHLDLQLPGVRLRPDKLCIHQLHSAQALDVLEADLQKLGRLGLAGNPWRPLIPVALSAMVED